MSPNKPKKIEEKNPLNIEGDDKWIAGWNRGSKKGRDVTLQEIIKLVEEQKKKGIYMDTFDKKEGYILALDTLLTKLKEI